MIEKTQLGSFDHSEHMLLAKALDKDTKEMYGDKNVQTDQKRLESQKFEKYLSDTLGLVRNKQKDKAAFEPWTCLSCLLSIVYNLYASDEPGLSSDASFATEMAASNFVIKPIKNDSGRSRAV